MENLTIHLITVVTLIVMVFVIIGLPYLIGIVIDRIFKTTVPDRDPIATWMIGGYESRCNWIVWSNDLCCIHRYI